MPKPPPADYGIGTVACLTGLTTHTIRAWEKRHGAVEARRDPSGRRRYSPADVECLTKLKQLVDLGERIGGLAGLQPAELDARLDTLQTRDTRQAAPAPKLRTAFFGPGARGLADTAADLCAVSDVNTTATAAEIADAPPIANALVVEMSSLAPAAVEPLTQLAKDSARAVIVVYGFARDEDLRRLAQADVIIARSPASRADLSRAISEASQQLSATAAFQRVTDTPAEPAEALPRFTVDELARIGSISTSIECECPHHLVTLISNLRAFELYSADCTNKNAADAAMHEYLFRETVRANQIFETALRRLVDYEGIEID